MDLPLGATATAVIVARPDGLGGITGAEFAVTGLPGGVVAIAQANPQFPIVLGDPFGDGVSVGFANCETASEVVLFTVTLMNVAATEGAILEVVAPLNPAAPAPDCPVMVQCDFPVFTKVCVQGSGMWLNGGPSPLPLITDPAPANGAAGVPLSPRLEWRDPGFRGCLIGIPHHAVYLGTDPDPPLFRDLWEPDWIEPGPLAPGTTYYWRVRFFPDLPGLVFESPIWSFTTRTTVAVEEKPWSGVKALYR